MSKNKRKASSSTRTTAATTSTSTTSHTSHTATTLSSTTSTHHHHHNHQSPGAKTSTAGQTTKTISRGTKTGVSSTTAGAAAASSEQQEEQAGLEEEQQLEEQQKGFKGKAKKDMQDVEGYHAEKASGERIDESRLNKALSYVKEENQKQKELKLQRMQELEKVKVSKEDIELIMNEMEVEKSVADRYLRENQGDLVAALNAMILHPI
ncbi:hypothetical protein G9A89_002486 [Geosiphon pyriformis]|nr:hypothetical protein G9A89_002486 [Geosiphon pyriformis]